MEDLADRQATIPERIRREFTPGKSFLQKFFEFLDLPGNVVQNALTGNLGGAGRNLADLAFTLMGARFIPGIGELEFSREGDRPDWGVVGELLTDPLTWLTFGGAGTAANLGKAAAKGAGKRLLGKQLTRQMTRWGLKEWLPAQATKTAARLTAKSPTAARLAQKAPEALQRIATRKVLRQYAPHIAAAGPEAASRASATMAGAGIRGGQFLRKIPSKALHKGGIIVELPFQEFYLGSPGKTIALAGKDPLGYLPPVLAARKIAALDRPARTIKKVLDPLSLMSPEGADVARQYINERDYLRKYWRDKLAAIFAGVDDETGKDIVTAMGKFDPRSPGAGINSRKAFSAKMARLSKIDPERAARGRKAMAGWQKASRQMYDEATGLGLFTPKDIRPEDYFPLQWTEKYANERALEALAQGEVGKAFGFEGPRAAKTRTKYYSRREYRTLQDFVEAGFDPELDIRKLALRRADAHAKSIANARLIRQANARLGMGKRLSPAIEKAKYSGVLPDMPGPPLEGGPPSPPELPPSPAGLSPPGRAAGGPLTSKGKGKGKRPVGLKPPAGTDFPPTGRGFPPKGWMPPPGWPFVGGKPLSPAKYVPRQPALQELSDKVLQKWIGRDAAGNLMPRKGLMKPLAKYNTLLFKGPLTVGIGPVPNVAFVTRNIVSGVFQGLTDRQIGPRGIKHLRAMTDAIVGKVAKAFGWNYQGGLVNRLMTGAADQLKIGSYTGKQIMELAKQDRVLSAAYASNEFLLDTMAAGGPSLKHRIMRIAPDITSGVENRMRLSAYVELLKDGVEHTQAGDAVAKAFIDYRYTSEGERLIRDLFPFSKFTLAQTPRTLEATLRQPVITAPLRAATRERTDEPLPEWMAGQPKVQVGSTPEGPLMLTSFGTPLEDLDKLGSGEGFGRTLEQSVVGNMIPPLQWAYTAASGRHPFYGREVSSMHGVPGAIRALPAGVQEAIGVQNIQGKSGAYSRMPAWLNQLMQATPGSRQIATLNRLLDDRRPVWARTVDLLTGVKIYSVDRDWQLQTRIRDYLLWKAQQGEVGVIQRFFDRGDTDPQLTAIIQDYYKLRKSKAVGKEQ